MIQIDIARGAVRGQGEEGVTIREAGPDGPDTGVRVLMPSDLSQAEVVAALARIVWLIAAQIRR